MENQLFSKKIFLTKNIFPHKLFYFETNTP